MFTILGGGLRGLHCSFRCECGYGHPWEDQRSPVAIYRLHGWDYVRELADDTASCVSDDISLGDVSSVSDGSPVARTVNKGAYMVAEFLRRVNGLRRGIRAER